MNFVNSIGDKLGKTLNTITWYWLVFEFLAKDSKINVKKMTFCRKMTNMHDCFAIIFFLFCFKGNVKTFFILLFFPALRKKIKMFLKKR